MVDVVCFNDLDPFGRDIDDPITELQQDVVHMLLESYGSNCDAIGRSIGLEDQLSGSDLVSIRHLIETKLVEDPRIDAATATLTDKGGGSIQIDVSIQYDTTALGISVIVDGNGGVRSVVQ